MCRCLKDVKEEATKFPGWEQLWKQQQQGEGSMEMERVRGPTKGKGSWSTKESVWMTEYIAKKS